MKTGTLIIISGPSGVGKGTIRAEVFKDESLKLNYSISMTTRKPRVGEQDGVDYFFVSHEQFEESIKNDELLEYAEFAGNYYGTPKHYVQSLLEKGRNVMLEIDVKGALQVMEKNPDCLSIFIIPPSIEVLEQRLRGRGTEAEEVILRRLSQAEREISTKDQYDFNVINDDLEKAILEVKQIIKENA